MHKPFIAAACLCAATIAEAEPVPLSGQAITVLVAGATVEIDTPLGTKLPVRYTLDGKISGQARDLASYLGAASDTGRWWVAADQLCHKWNRWFDSEPQCLAAEEGGPDDSLAQPRWQQRHGRDRAASTHPDRVGFAPRADRNQDARCRARAAAYARKLLRGGAACCDTRWRWPVTEASRREATYGGLG
jgi:hypothetical protein